MMVKRKEIERNGKTEENEYREKKKKKKEIKEKKSCEKEREDRRWMILTAYQTVWDLLYQKVTELRNCVVVS